MECSDYYKYIGHILIQNDLQARQDAFNKAVDSIVNTERISKEAASKCLSKAFDELSLLEERLKQSFLGSPQTRHGEAAEELYRYFDNADRAIYGNNRLVKGASGRTSPEDLLIFGKTAQLKSCKSLNATLLACIEDMKKYDNELQIIPKDQYELFDRILKGDVDGIPAKTVEAIQNKIEMIRKLNPGRNIDELFRPHKLTYDQIHPNNNYQEGQYDSIVDDKKNELLDKHKQHEKDIKKKSKSDRNDARNKVKPSMSSSFKISSFNGLLSGSLSSVTLVYAKLKTGKKIEDFSVEDWKEVGVKFAAEGSKGFGTSFGIYWLSNNKHALNLINNEIQAANTLATSATLFVNTAVTIADFYNDYKKGIINKDDFIDCCYSASIEQAIVSAGALLGAPIPVIGPIIGATIARYTYKFVASAVNEYDIACSNLAKERSHIVDLKVEHEFSEYKKKITNNYARYDKLLEKTAHPSINLARTFRLCEERGINPERDLHVFIERFPIKK